MSLQKTTRATLALASLISSIALAACNADVLTGAQAGTYQLRFFGFIFDTIAVPGTYRDSPATTRYMLEGSFQIDRRCNWSARWLSAAVIDGQPGAPQEFVIADRCIVESHSGGRTRLWMHGNKNLPSITIGEATITRDTVYYGGFTFAR